MEDQAQLVSADDGRQDDSACRSAADGKTRRRDRCRGQGQSRDLHVAPATGRERDREGRPRCAGDGNALAGDEFSFLRSRHVLKRNSMRLAAALLAALASFVAGPNAALPAQTQHQDQVPGFYRLKVGDLEVTSLYDGTG